MTCYLLPSPLIYTIFYLQCYPPWEQGRSSEVPTLPQPRVTPLKRTLSPSQLLAKGESTLQPCDFRFARRLTPLPPFDLDSDIPFKNHTPFLTPPHALHEVPSWFSLLLITLQLTCLPSYLGWQGFLSVQSTALSPEPDIGVPGELPRKPSGLQMFISSLKPPSTLALLSSLLRAPALLSCFSPVSVPPHPMLPICCLRTGTILHLSWHAMGTQQVLDSGLWEGTAHLVTEDSCPLLQALDSFVEKVPGYRTVTSVSHFQGRGS